jgi:hypothetical protein
MTEYIYLCCGEINKEYRHFYVKTTKEDIKGLADKFNGQTREQANGIFKNAYNEINKYKEVDLKPLFDNNSEQYEKWTSFIMIYFVSRLILSDGKLKLPILGPESVEQIINQTH